MELKTKINRRYFESKLPKVDWNGDQGRANCPFHHDRHPSLSVNARKGVYRCHACGAKGDLVEFERRFSGCDWKTAQCRIAKLAKRGGGSNLRSHIVDVYSYEDEKGNLRCQQVRFEPKTFRSRRPAENGEWIWNLEGVVKILYRLPEVLAAKEVYIAEGEKDIETLRAWGLVATCNLGGAGKWKDEYSKVLKGKEVIVLQDDDEPGHKHAQAVAQSVARHGTEVRVIPPFPNAKDVTEWVERGGTKRKLKEMVACSKPIERGNASVTDPVKSDSLSADDWRAKPLRSTWAVRLAESLFHEYLVLPLGISFVAALWSIGTYAFEDFDCFPYLTITSPTKRCGKTRFGEILELLCCRSRVEAHKEQISKAYFKQKLDFLKDREADIWEPLFAIAAIAVPERLEELKRIAIRLSDQKANMDIDDSQGLRLLADIRTIFNGTKRNGVPSAELVERLRKDAATHWGEELTQTKLARLLRPFGISSEQIWIEERNFRGYRREDFKSAFERYLPPENR